MTTKALEQFDFKTIMLANIKSRTSAWHEHPGEENYRWHCSALSGCPRAQIFKRAQLATDPIPDESLINFELGHAAHRLLEDGLFDYAAQEDRLEVVHMPRGEEPGAHHQEINLAGKTDGIIRWDGQLALLELKTERGECPFCHRGGAAAFRAKDAKEAGFTHSADPKHVLQAVGTAMCYESDPDFNAELRGESIGNARLLYLKKNDWLSETVPVDLSLPVLREQVVTRVHLLDQMWAAYLERGTLPEPYEPSHWNCRSVKGSELGRYCQSRSICMTAQRRGV